MRLPTPEEVRDEMERVETEGEIRFFDQEFPKLWEILKRYADGEIDELPYV